VSCPRCHGNFREVIARDSETGELCHSLLCVLCGNVEDDVIRENREPERREFLKIETNETRTLSKVEKIIAENEPDAIRFSF
jgi:hypothetical protein